MPTHPTTEKYCKKCRVVIPKSQLYCRKCEEVEEEYKRLKENKK